MCSRTSNIADHVTASFFTTRQRTTIVGGSLCCSQRQTTRVLRITCAFVAVLAFSRFLHLRCSTRETAPPSLWADDDVLIKTALSLSHSLVQATVNASPLWRHDGNHFSERLFTGFTKIQVGRPVLYQPVCPFRPRPLFSVIFIRF